VSRAPAPSRRRALESRSRRRVLGACGAVATGSLAGCLGTAFGRRQVSGAYDRATVIVEDADGDGARLASVEVRVADTTGKRYTGLSDTESLGPDEGMLFVHESAGEYAYVMREMDFPLDIIFADPDGVITTVHTAPLPPEGTSGGDLERYRGRGQFVLEVNAGYAEEHCIAPGDRFRFRDLDTDLV